MLTLLRVMWAFLKRDFRMSTSYRTAFVLQFGSVFVGATFLYFTSRIFSQVSSPFLAPYGGNYFAFVIVGVAFGDYMGAGLSTFSSTIRSGQVTGTLEMMLLSPTGLPSILLSSSLWSFAFPSLRILVFMVSGVLLFGLNLSQANLLSAFVVLVMATVCLSGLGLLSASFVMVFKEGDPIAGATAVTAALLGGLVYPVEVLPGPLQTLASLQPFTYAFQAIRLAVLQGYDLVQLRGDLLALAIFSVILIPLGFIAFASAVRRAKIHGSLAQY